MEEIAGPYDAAKSPVFGQEVTTAAPGPGTYTDGVDQEPPNSFKCSGCGAPIALDAKFCGHCGKQAEILWVPIQSSYGLCLRWARRVGSEVCDLPIPISGAQK